MCILFAHKTNNHKESNKYFPSVLFQFFCIFQVVAHHCTLPERKARADWAGWGTCCMFQCSNDTRLDLKWYPLRLVHQFAGPGIIARTSTVAKSGYFAKIIRLRLRIFSWICMQTISSATHHQQRNKLRSDEKWHNLVLCWSSCQCRLRHDVTSLRHLSLLPAP